MKIEDFPLAWPEGLARTSPEERAEGRFRIDFEAAYDGLVDEVERLHDDPGRDVVVSTNVPVGARGLPVAVKQRIADPGAAVYLSVDGRWYAVACDTYLDVHHNLRALAQQVAALRSARRHGTRGQFAEFLAGIAREIAAAPEAARVGTSEVPPSRRLAAGGGR